MADPNIDNNNAIDPVMSDLSLDDQAQLFQLLKVEAGMTLTMRKNGAVADGVDVDIAQACFNNMNESTQPLVVDYKIEGGTAVFLENKQTTIRKHTNKSLSSTVQLINLTPGKGMIKATPYLNPKMAPAPVEYEFIGKPRKLNLVLTVTTDNQFSDGVAANVVTATLTDENDGNKPVANEKLEFKLNGTAQFKGTNPVTTDAKGKATISLVSNANANISVTVTCTVLSEPSVSKNIIVTFKAKPKDLKLVLTIDANNRYADGIQKNTVVATLTDPNNNNKPVSNEKLEFKLYGTAKFVGANLVTTDANGKAIVSLTSDAKTDVAIKVTCTLVSNTAVKQEVTINFKAIPKPEFTIIRIKPRAVTSHTDYGHVRSVITLPAGAPAQKYTIRFKKTTNPYYKGTFRNYGITKTKSWGNTSTLDIPVTAAGGVTNVDAWIWYADGTDFTQSGFSFFQADLLDANGQVIYSGNNGAWAEFTGQPKPVTPPPPPPSVPRWPIDVVVLSAEDVYGPTYPISSNHHRCELVIDRRSVPDVTFTISIISNGQYFALGDSAGKFGSTISAYAPQTFFLGILRNVTSDLGATIEVRAAQGVVWRGIVYPRSIRLTVIN